MGMKITEKIKAINSLLKIIVVLILIIIVFTPSFEKDRDKFNYRIMDENNSLNYQFYQPYILQINSPLRLISNKNYPYIQIGKFYQWEKDVENEDYLGSIHGEKCKGINCFYYRCLGIHIHEENVFGYTFYNGKKFGYESCYGIRMGEKSDIVY